MFTHTDYNTSKLAVAYYRYSSASQNEASITQQQQHAHQWATTMGLVLVKEYSDAAKTGTNTDRPGFQQMMNEIDAIAPAYLILWKVDRLGRNRQDLMTTRQRIRNAGCRIHYIEGIDPTEDPESIIVEAMNDAMAECYSLNLSKNIRRGVQYNAQHALANGHKILGFTIGPDKRYHADPATAPAVRQAFIDYAAGKPLQTIADELNAAGTTTVRGHQFTAHSLNKTLKSRAYLGEYNYAGHVIPAGMPQLVDQATFDAVQRRFSINKRGGAKTKALRDTPATVASDYWLTTTLLCEHCGASMQGVSGTSKTGRKYRYYYCLNQRKKTCHAKPLRKHDVEGAVTELVEQFLADTDTLTRLAVDMAEHYRRTHSPNPAILESLNTEKQTVEGKIANFVQAIAAGIFTTATQTAMEALEQRQEELDQAIQTEQAKTILHEDAISIAAFYQRFANAKLSNPATRDLLLHNFIDKITASKHKLTITTRYYDDGEPITHEQLTRHNNMGTR